MPRRRAIALSKRLDRSGQVRYVAAGNHLMNTAFTRPLATFSPELIARFAAIVGEKYAITDPVEQEPYLIEGRGLYRGSTPLVLRPGSVAEGAAILKLASETVTPIVPQGGNTGLVGGQIPPHGEGILSPQRPRPIREDERPARSMTCR